MIEPLQRGGNNIGRAHHGRWQSCEDRVLQLGD